MRIARSHSVHGASRTAAACLLAILALPLVAQDPAPAPAPPPANPPAPAPAAPPEAAAETPRPEGERRQRPRRAAVVIEAGTVHPVAGPAIADGVVVIRGERIVAIGKKGEVEVPENATVRSFPTGHVYPGLIDAATDAYTDASLRADGSADGGSSFVDDLRLQDSRHDELVQAGITTAYVTVRSPATVRGQGGLVRPRQNGFDVWRGKERTALHLRMTDGLGPSHPLQRQQRLQAAAALFDGLDEFRKARTDHEEALAKYEKEFAEYLAFHQKKKDGDKKPEDKPAEAPKTGDAPPAERQGPPGRPRGERGNRGGGGNEPPKTPGESSVTAEELEAALATLLAALAPAAPGEHGEHAAAAQDPAKEPAKQEPPKPAGQPGAPAPEKKDEAPKRPTYPKPPADDPQRDALLQVLDGDLALRVEAHRPDELRAALHLQRERQIPVLVLEQAYGAAGLEQEIAEAGASVVLTEGLPVPFEPPYDAFEPARLPAKLGAAGVPFAIASGRATHAGLLPLLAAAAVGGGLPRDQALRAITLTPAEILGVAQDTGSLQAGKLADVLVTDRPLFQTDSRVLLVLAKGRTEYEVK
jgi:imidazolonepropionase-like amidohydrolase